MSASVSWVDVAIFRRSAPTRRVRSTKSGINANAKRGQLPAQAIIPIIVAITVVTFETIDVAVLVTTLWTPPMSFEIRRLHFAGSGPCEEGKRQALQVSEDCGAKVVHHALADLVREQCLPDSDSRSDRIAIIPAVSSEAGVWLRSIAWSSHGARTPAGRRGGRDEDQAEHDASRRRFARNSPAIRLRFARRTAGSAGRTGAQVVGR